MRLATICGVFLLVGCGPTAGSMNGEGDGVDGGVQADARPSAPRADAAPSQVCDEMDILFVIDNSGSMGQEQANLIANFPQFISVLDTFRNDDGDLIDYHVGVTTTGVSKTVHTQVLPGFPPITDTINGEDGHLQVGTGCNMPRRWLERGDANVASAFSCAANVGTRGSPDEMPLEGARLALTERIADGSNAGFVRQDALLAVVILTDEQDCSRTDNNINLSFGQDLCSTPSPVADYVAALDAVKGDRTKWATAVIAGVDPQPCSSELGNAQPATRLTEFAGLVGSNAVTSSICQGDLASSLAAAMDTFKAACNSFDPIE
jgi:hypothetical protein